ncbi:MAG: GH116 family glycosyl-hydrolase [Verrucomicrobiota bacterium]
MKTSAAALLGLSFSQWPAMAGPFTREDFEMLVPADKKLSAEWVKSLFTRGTPELLRGNELKYVGMPIGGVGAGHLYLGGDGRLWHWDIFNQFVFTADKGDDCHYANPLIPRSPLAQKFSLKIGGKSFSLDRDGFAGVSFRGEYPIGIVEYADPAMPLTVKLEAFSPFIPLNTDDSSLPATVFKFTVRNSGTVPVEAVLAGDLENGVCLHHRKQAGILRNRIVRKSGVTLLLCAAESVPDAVSNNPADQKNAVPLEELSDFGTMSLALLDVADEASGDQSASFAERLSGSLGRKIKLAPGESVVVTFILAWHFPNLSIQKSFKNCGRYYATKFSSAQAVVEYVVQNFPRLEAHTKLWRDTWYDSTLPFWFLDRTFLNTSILATSTCYRLANGRFYGWEGVGNCKGTCGHVYQYAHAAARLFPDLERDVRERVDFGLAQQPDGSIHFRGEFNKTPAVDAQAGYILRALREHQMSVDETFLRRNWPQIKRATEWLMARDENGDGILEGKQHNTLDTDWYGPVAWLSGLYLASLLGAAQMADVVGDAAFAAQCRNIFETGRKKFVAHLFDREYFINKVDPNHLDAINSGTGCEIDQVFGQSWAFQVGLPRVLPEKDTVAALKSLWRYNFSPDVGPYRAVNKPGRWYAMPGEAGLLMCSFPRSDWDFTKASGKGKPDWAAGYFNECMNGFEYQVAGHMIWEGMVMEGLAVTRAVHDRYHASRRNPWNEIECGDHYARSMASYGVYLAACGFEYDGPKQHIGFAPKLTPENFKCTFTSAEGWGCFSQKTESGKRKAEIAVKWGKLKLKTIALEDTSASSATVSLAGISVGVKLQRSGKTVLLVLKKSVEIPTGEDLEIILS